MSDCLKVSVLASVPIFSEVLKGERKHRQNNEQNDGVVGCWME